MSIAFLFFTITNIPHKGTIRHKTHCVITCIKLSIKIQCFYRDENDLAPDDQHYVRGERNTLCFGNILKNDNSSCFLIYQQFQLKVKFFFLLIYYKSEDGYPNFF